MINLQHLLQEPELYRHVAKVKNSSVDVDRLITLANEKKELEAQLVSARTEGNKIANEIKMSGGKPAAQQIEAGKSFKETEKNLTAQLNTILPEFNQLLLAVPNLPSEDTPEGKDDSENVEIRAWGTIPEFNFAPKEHWQLGEELGLIDMERAAKVSGSRFTYLKGDLALLQFALMQFTMHRLSDVKFVEEVISDLNLNLKPTAFTAVIPPVLIKPEPFHKMARLEPREERYHIPGDDLYLIGSAEHTLGAMYIDETLEEAELPIRYVGYSTSFRREAGSYGKDMKGILRLHQFDKLEMEVFSTPETSLVEQDLLVGLQEKMLQILGIPYRVVICCTGDQGDPDARHLDIECWLPGQDKYRETHSADLMTDYQTRRMNTRLKRVDGTKDYVHTNDATAFAMGRTIIAIMENLQQEDGTILVPEALQPFMGKKVISK